MSKGERIKSDFNIAMHNPISSPFGRHTNSAFEQMASPFGGTQINFANYASATSGGPFLVEQAGI